MRIRRIYESIKNVIRWVPITYKDKEWDSQYLFEIMKFKLSNMERAFREYGHHVNAERDADEMHKCVLLLDRVIKDEYYENVFKHHNKKWGEPKMNFVDIGNPNGKRLDITHANVKTEEDKIKERKEFRVLCQKENDMRQQDLDLLFKTMNRKILGWWD